MITQPSLTIVALAIACLSMLLSLVALWPQWKDQFAAARDVILWAALAVVVVAVVKSGLTRPLPSDPQSAPASSLLDVVNFQKYDSPQPTISAIPLQRDPNFLAPIER